MSDLPLKNRLLGLETEYGILVEGKDPSHLVEESAALVRSYDGVYAAPWDYSLEDPRRDARGFRVRTLAVNPVDLRYEAARPTCMSENEARSDRVLPNGARLYNDHGHPEYSTPECASVVDLVAHDRAGERIVLRCAQAYQQHTGARVTIFKNNTDYHGMSYGCHEDYLVSRELPFTALQTGLMPFLVTRQVFAGAGKVGVEATGRRTPHCLFQLSQRADFFTEEASVDTLHRRPILNTRDEPHADPALYRRLHVIAGDSNMMEYATALKVGTTSLVLSILEELWLPPFEVAEPVEAIKRISRDETLRWPVLMRGGAKVSAVDVQRAYLNRAIESLSGRDDETDWVLAEWANTLDALASDPLSLADRLDWAAKRTLLQHLLQEEGKQVDLAFLQGVELQYHNIAPDQGLYAALEQSDRVVRVVSDDDIERAITQPPPNTRAYLRGTCVARFPQLVQSVTWSRISLCHEGGAVIVDMSGMVDGTVADVNKRIADATTIRDIVRAIERKEQ
jgi:proteasome accessory factor A